MAAQFAIGAPLRVNSRASASPSTVSAAEATAICAPVTSGSVNSNMAVSNEIDETAAWTSSPLNPVTRATDST